METEHIELLIEEKTLEITKKIESIENKIDILMKMLVKTEEDNRFSSKQAKEYAMSNGINIGLIQGTGNNGKITLVDLKKYVKRQHPCKGVNSNGDPCHRFGASESSDGEWYCTSHLKKF